jgi:hypothetical protein
MDELKLQKLKTKNNDKYCKQVMEEEVKEAHIHPLCFHTTR